MTPLHLAAKSGHIKKVNYLCDKGADINIPDDDGVNLNVGRLEDWVWISLISRQVLKCFLKQQFICIQTPKILVIVSCM